METLEIHSKDFLVKWVHAPEGSIIGWQVKPLKKSINFAIYGKSEDDLSGQRSATEEFQQGYSASQKEENKSASSNRPSGALRLRSDSVNSVNEFSTSAGYKTKSRSSMFSSNLNNSDLTLIKDYDKLVSGELVYGKYEVQKGGMFAFIFDNSFSKTTGKKVLFSTKIINLKSDTSSNSTIGRRSAKVTFPSLPSSATSINVSNNTAMGGDPKQQFDKNTNILRPKNGELLQGILFKKRRKKLQGFTKRYFILSFKYGTLSYFRNNDNKLRGQMPIKQSIVSANAQKRELIIDSGMEVWDLKALNVADFNTWVDAFNQVKRAKDSIVDQTVEETVEDLSYLCSELELISSKVAKLRSQSSLKLSGNFDEISSDLKRVLDHFKPQSIANDTMSVFSHDYFDAKEYIEAMNSGVVLLDQQSDNLGNVDEIMNSTARFLSDESFKKPEDGDQFDVVSSSSSSSSEQDSVPSVTTDTEISRVLSSTDDMDDTLYPLPHEKVDRNCDIPLCTHTPPSLLGIVRKSVGTDLSSIAMPVSMNEPISALQKFSELVEYSDLINNSLQSNFNDNGEKILRIATFAVSYLSSLRVKERNIRKPFNPLLGETFELVREDLGFRFISEKVCHRPPVFAMFVESEKWLLSYSPSPGQKFWGKNMEITTGGVVKLTINSTGEVFTWSQPTTLLKNIIAGEKYCEPASSVTVKSTTGYKAVIEFAKGSMFSGRSEDLTIKSYDPLKEEMPYTVTGKWTESLTLKTKTTEKLIWEVGNLLPDVNKKYGFTCFTGSLNKITPIEKDSMAPTDSRLRPDMQLYEKGDLEGAEKKKIELEEMQRERRKKMEANSTEYKPLFFKHVGGNSADSGEWIYIRGEKSYWNRRKMNDWSDLPKLW
ncbi:uncharacterized protein PRCAT00000511001 [Priceomyces carsonii]|uniref:uncharacterized protein n=1 Tax=Priceomyces carsonii TaxID=28549 RepID=UPI002ED87035|nr:unnamed protein product [Priceomyces carsonii]